MSLISSEIIRRISNLKTQLEKSKIDAVFIIQISDLYYFSNTVQQGILFVHSQAEPVLFIKRDADRARKESPLANIIEISSLKDIYNFILSRNLKINRLGLELDVLPFNYFKKISEQFSSVEIVDTSYFLRRIRMIKSPLEIKKLKKAGQLIDETFKEIMPCIKVGVKELDVAYELEYIARKKGHCGIIRSRAFNQEMFYGHYLSGKNALLVSYVDSPTAGLGRGSFFSQGSSNRKITANKPFSIDFVFNYEGYCVDMTRIFYLGKPDKRYLKVYSVALEIHNIVREQIKKGLLVADMVKLVYNIVKKNRLESIFMGPEGKQVSYIGHGIGLELDELPILTTKSKEVIEEGLVFALEPKFFIPQTGLCGLESTYLFDSNGLLSLTSFPENIQILD